MSGAIVLEQHDRSAIVCGAERVEVTIIIIIAEVGSPCLSMVLHSVGVGLVAKMVGAIVHEKPIPTQYVVRIIMALAAVADEEVQIAIIVEIGIGAAIVPAHIAGGSGGPVDIRVVVHRNAAGIGEPDIRRAIIMASENIHLAIVVHITNAHALGEDVRTVKIGQRVHPARCDAQPVL